MADFVSNPFPRDALLGPFVRADLELHGVDQVVPSYEGRVFLNNPAADDSTDLTRENGFLGAFHIFGKVDCWGEEGHCDDPLPRRKFDHRRGPVVAAKIRLTVKADLLRDLAAASEGDLVLSVVAAMPKRADYLKAADGTPLKFKRFSIITYA
jgi:hypothetical protein